ncbi:hypothetical protein PAMP_005172 [Pampus punctatissimus]
MDPNGHSSKEGLLPTVPEQTMNEAFIPPTAKPSDFRSNKGINDDNVSRRESVSH